MKSTAPLILASAVLLCPLARAAEPAIIAKARAYCGPESVISKIRSIRFTGKLVQQDPSAPDDPTKATTADVEITFQKPFEERIVLTTPKSVVTTGLDDFDCWQRQQVEGKPATVAVLNTAMALNLRADTWENLYFYQGLEAAGGFVEDQGSATIDGIDCEKILFHHNTTIVFYRYFDKATGRLVYTETEAGVRIHEEGSIMVDGVRFPSSIVTQERIGDKDRKTVYTFDKVVVNETYPASMFAVPLN